jgi:molecular chaperone DnaK
VPGDWKLSIDLGAKFTAAAMADDDGIVDLKFGADAVLPSVVALGPGGQVLTGRQALDHARANPRSALRHPKQAVAAGAKVRLDGVTALVADLVAAVLERVHMEAVRCQGGRKPAEVILCHPATWADAEMVEIAEAASAVGLPGVAFVADPVAAARHYLTQCPSPQCGAGRPLDLADGASLVVVDFGAGLDVTVIRLDGGQLAVAALGGDAELGGDDLDERLTDVLADHAYAADPQAWDAVTRIQDPGSAAELAQLEWRVTEGRQALSRLLYADIEVPGYQTAFRITRREFDAAARQQFERAVTVTEAAITMAGLSVTEPPALALAGAVSRTPAVSDTLSSHFGVLPAVAAEPKSTVAHGALLTVAGRPGGYRGRHVILDPDNDDWLSG